MSNVNDRLKSRATIATKWSLLTEFLVKIITPITQVILARILAPEAFGVVATVTMVTSFADMLSDSGFQKYLVQHDFENDEALYRSANVAFWSNLGISFALFGLIAVYRDRLAVIVGNEGLGDALLVASTSLPLTSFSSIQRALFQRNLDYKTIMPVRVLSAFIPLVVTLPLALYGFDYWSLIIGTIAGNLFNAIALTALSSWKPKMFYSFQLLREMFAFCGWSLLEAISVWITAWAGTFIVSGTLDSYHLGLYKQPMTLVNAAFALVTGATTPVLFSSLSKLQNSENEFSQFFLDFQYSVAMFVLPIGVGMFFFRDFLTDILLGSQWEEASLMVGCWGLSSGVLIILSHYCSEVFRSRGKPRVSLICQCIYMAVVVPVLSVFVKVGFEEVVIATSLVRIVCIAITQTAMSVISSISISRQLDMLRVPIIGSFVMGVTAYFVSNIASKSILDNIVAILTCIIVYICICWCFPSGRQFLKKLILNIVEMKEGN